MTRILMAGGVAALSVAVVVGQTSQPTSTSRPAASPVARTQAAPQAPTPVKSVAPTTGEEATKSRALVDQVLCHLPQRPAQDRRPGPGQGPVGLLASRRSHRAGGKSRAQGPRWPDAADELAPAGCSHAWSRSSASWRPASTPTRRSICLRPDCIVSIAPSTPTRFAICSRSKWTPPSSCRRTTRRAGSTTSPVR